MEFTANQIEVRHFDIKKWIIIFVPILLLSLSTIFVNFPYVIFCLVGLTAFVFLLKYLYHLTHDFMRMMFLILIFSLVFQQFDVSWVLFPRPSKVVLLVFFLFFIQMLKEKEIEWVRTDMNLLIWAFFLVQLFSLVNAIDFKQGINTLRVFCQWGLLYFLVVNLLYKDRFVLKALRFYALTGWVASLVIMSQFLTGYSQLVRGEGFITGRMIPRLHGVFVDANVFAAYMVTLIPLCFAFLHNSQKRKQKILWIISLMFYGTAFILAFSRSGILGLLVALIILLLFYPKLRPVIFKVSVTVILLLTMLFVWGSNRYPLLSLGFQPFFKGFTDLRPHTSGGLHLWLYDTAWEIFLHNPLFGVGLGNFHHNILKYSELNPSGFQLFNSASQRGITVPTHSSWLQILAETGIVGFTIYFLIVIFAIRKIWRVIVNTKKPDPEYCSVSRACLASLIGFSACGIFYSLQMYPVGWFFVGIAVALEKGDYKR
jgi:O-antigen ligase